MKNTCATLLLLLFYPLGWSATVDITREATGYGDTYQEALSSSLLEGLRQIKGLEIGTEKTLKLKIIESITEKETTITRDADVSEDIFTSSNGRIRSYDVISIEEPKKNFSQWKVVTLVTIPQYKQIVENDTRKTLAVLPFIVKSGRAGEGDGALNLSESAMTIADKVISQLSQSRKFAVVNRSYEEAFNAERELLSSNLVSAEEATRLGQKLGADIIIIGTLYDLQATREVKEFYGVKFPRSNASANLFYNVIEAATEKVLWADTIDYSIDLKNDEDDVLSKITNKISNSISNGVLDVIYPIKILEALKSESILLNQGGKRAKIGQQLEVYTPGREIADPDTGMPILVDGDFIALLEVIKVLPKYSVGKLVKGKLEDIKVGAITRAVIPEQESVSDVPPEELTPGSSGKPWNWN